ncbi:MAG: hypothetical protein ACTSQF_14955 [Candidatus Heimdallarchaeaceae archaeon]
MTVYTGIPDDYKLYLYSALGMMFGGVILFLVSLFDTNEFLFAASLTAIICGFLISMGMALYFIRKKKKDRNVEILISTLTRIILLVLFGFSTYFIVFSVFYSIDAENPFSTNLWIATAIAVPIVVVALIVADIITIRRREKKKEQEEQEKKLRKEFEEDLVE